MSYQARKVEENATAWHTQILKWETLTDTDFAKANNITNFKISLLSKVKIAWLGMKMQKRYPWYNKEFEMLCEEIEATSDGLTKIQGKKVVFNCQEKF